jgi:hypothetical protein
LGEEASYSSVGMTLASKKTTGQPYQINNIYEKKSANGCCACRNRGKLFSRVFQSATDY